MPSLRPVCETMEERILHSADLAPLLVSDMGNGLALQQPVQQASANEPLERGNEIAFVDLSVPDADTLLADLRTQQAAGRALEIVTIAADQDGLELMGRTLAGRSDIGAVHVLAHGSDGVMQLGHTRLDANTLLTRADAIAAWSGALTPDADLLLYGCDFAQSGVGQQLVRDLALLTGADVAASTDLTGAAAQGGNWTLEFGTGRIEAAGALSSAGQQTWAGTLAVGLTSQSSGDTNSATTSYTFSHNINGGADRLLLVSLVLGNSASSATAVTYNGAALSLVATQNSPTNHVRVELWSLVAPVVGSGSVTVTLGSASTVVAGATSYSGVHQSTPLGNIIKGSGNSATASVVVPASSGDLVVDIVGARQVSSFITGANQTQNFVRTQGTGASDLSGYSTRENGAASVTMSNDLTSANQNWAAIAVQLRQVSATLLADAPMGTSGNLSGSGDGTGWAGNWSGGGSSIRLSSGSLSDPTGLLPVSGGKAQFQLASLIVPSSATAIRDLSTSVGATGTTTWLSFLVQPDTSGINYAGIEFGSSSATVGFAGFNNGRFIVGAAGTTGTAVSGINAVNGQNTLLVLKLEHLAGNDVVTLYVNPTPGLAAPDSIRTASASIDLGTFTRIAVTGSTVLIGSNTTIIDEIRVGRTFAEVAPTAAPVITSNGGGATASVSIAENTTAVTTVTAVDYNSASLTYSISGGADSGLFQIDAATGVLRFRNAPDYETPLDAGTNNVYDVIVRVSDGSYFDTQAIAVTVTDIGGPITVDTTSDIYDGDVSSVEALFVNKGSDGLISLREAISAANNSPGMDVIILPGGTYTLTRLGAGENLNATGDLDIRDGVTITGAGASGTVISGGGATAVLHIISGSSVISGVTIRDGNTSSSGGGIEVNIGGSLTLSQSVVRNNSSTAGHGGGITNNGSLTLVDVELRDNSAYDRGGAIHHTGSALVLERVTLAGNTAWQGAGLYGAGGGQTLTNVTISGNTAGQRGGGLYLTASATLQNVTIAGNAANPGGGGGIFVPNAGSPTVTLRNVLLANNTNGNLNKDDNSSGVISLGNNLSTANNAELNQTTDLKSVTANIGALADNGGFTRTHALLPTSVAVNAGSTTGAPATDQRGGVRFGAPDIGAFELAGSANTAPVLAGIGNLQTINEDPTGDNGTLVSTLIAGRVTDPDAGAQAGIAVIAANNTNGSWQYSVDGGSNWLAFGTPTLTAARLLAADALTRVRFVPAANWYGTVASGLEIRAWDRTSGSSGATADASNGGSSSAFSLGRHFAGIAVNAVNDAPSGTSTTLVMAKNSSRTLVRADFGFADGGGESNAFASVRVQVPSAGSLRLNGVLLSVPTEVTVAQLDANLLVFTPAAGASGSPYATIGFQVRDDGGTTNGGVDLDPTVRVLSMQVTNQAPVITSDGGAASGAISRPENSTAVTTVVATDPEGDALSYSISGADVARFSIDAGGVLRFIAAPSFEVAADANADNIYDVTVIVTDSSGASATQNLAVSITDVYGAAGVASGQLWFTTAGNQGMSAGGTSWNAGQVLQYGNQGDRFDVDGGLTQGSVDPLAGFAETLPVRAMHYVQNAITIGAAGNTQFALNPGDLVLVLDPGGGSVLRNGITIDRMDIVVFRPTAAGDYATGTYFMLLDDGVRDGLGGPYEVHGLSLVENDITVGGQFLAAGSFVVAHSTPALHNSIYWFTASSTAGTANTGTTTTTNAQLLLDGSAFNLASGGDKISGLHLLTIPTTFNDTVLAAGTLLLSIDGATHSVGPIAQRISQDSNDIVALTFSDAVTVTTAALLFDGSDLPPGGTMNSSVNGFTVVTGAATNSVPTVAAPLLDQSTNEDAPYSFTVPAGTFSDADPGDVLTLTARLADNSLLPSWLTFNPATRVFSGTPANAQVGAITIRVTATDAQGATATSDFTLTVVNVNDAPVLMGANNLSPINEDAVNDNGTLVSDLILGKISDPDASASEGIAITAADNSLGTWQYSLDRSNWFDVGAVSATSALLLAADAGTAVRFVATAHWNGTVANSLSFRAWDRSSGVAGDKVDTSTNGGTSAFSNAVANSGITVAAINDAPVITPPAGIAVAEDVATPLTGFVFSDVDANGADVTVVFGVDAGVLSGTGAAGVTLLGSMTGTVTLTGSITAINDFIAAGQLRFTTAPDTTADVTLTVAIDDGGNTGADPGTSGSASSESAQSVLLISVTAVNDAPVLDNSATPVLGSVQEDAGAPAGAVGTLVQSLVDLAADPGGLDNVSDVDGAGATGIAVIAADSANGSWFFSVDDGATWSALGPVGNGSARLLAANELTRIYFQANADFNGSIANAIVFRAWDQSAGFNGQGLVDTTTNGGATAFSLATVAAGITVDAVNDAPDVNAPASIGVTEDQPTSVTGIVFSDVDADSASVVATFTVASGTLAAASAGGVSVAGLPQALVLTGTIADLNTFIAGGNLRFTNAPGITADVALGITINDGGNTGPGLPLNAVASTTLVVSPLNKAPAVNAPATVSATEDVASAITGISFADPDAGTAIVTATFSVSSGSLGATSGGGVTASGAGSPVVTLSGSIADINAFIDAGRLVFTTASNATAAVALRSAIDDGGHSGLGGARSTFALSTIVVTPVNDAPVLTAQWGDQTVAHARPAALQIPAASFTDPDAGDTLHYAATLSDGTALPAWLGFDAATRSFSGTPSAADAGMLTVRVTTTDDAGASAQMLFRLLVLAPDPAPTPAPEPEPEAVPADDPSPAATPAGTNNSNAAAVPTTAEPQGDAASAPAPVPELVVALAATPTAPDTLTLEIDTSIVVAPQRQFNFDVAATLPTSQADTVLAAALLTQFSDIATSASSDMFTNEDLLRKLEELKRQMLQQESTQQTVLASSIALTSGLSIGYVVWL
ncbi:MAG: DUF4347 domain-containing protein, partial [Rhodoferax sp.]|nr:DUF4347 domain-containing protein [Rhodoferax sp.]